MRRLTIVLLAAGLAVAGAFGGWCLARPSGGNRAGKVPTLRVYGDAPRYQLTDQLGRSVDSKAFAGRVRVVTFLFPYCTEYCPYIARWMVDTGKLLQREGWGSRVQLVSFNVDAGHSSGVVLRAFMSQYGWSPRDTRWEFLTGTPAAIRHVVTGGYHISYERVAGNAGRKDDSEVPPEPHGYNPLAVAAHPDYDVEHNDSVVIVDREGRIRAVITRAYRLRPEQVVSLIRKAWKSS